MRVALVNTNRIRPPIAPIGLDYVAEALVAAGHEALLLDLCWEERWEDAVDRFFRDREYGLVGVTIRNTDDCSLPTRESFLPGCARIVARIRARTEAPVVLGGVGFSVMPETVLDRCGAEAGIRGDGEFAFARLAGRIGRRRSVDDLPGLLVRRDGRWRANPVSFRPLSALPAMGRGFADNRRYFREGGQAGIETKRGCPGRCAYCADPLAKGRRSRLRPPDAVADELGRLAAMGIDHVHTCDSEFNVPGAHAEAVCREIVRRGLGEKLRWYAYCAPVPFTRDLAELMRRAGCAGINFGADSGDDRMLARLGRAFRAEDVRNAVRLCREAGIAVMLDLLLGSPGETRASVARTVAMVKDAGPDRAGVAIGVRVYPGTKIAGAVARGKPRSVLIGGEDLSAPVFFVEPAIAQALPGLVADLTRDDDRFLFFNPEAPGSNYNYNANDVLSAAIRKGHRGAYWDILRRVGRTRRSRGRGSTG